MSGTKADSSSSSCPVDPASRAAWLEQAESAHQSPPPSPGSTSTPPTLRRFTFPIPHSRPANSHKLALDRETSSIPRAPTTPPTVTPNPTSTPLSSPPENADGNWIYPSEKMFFDAMSRKSFSPHAPDMASVVPIHNAVNERAWAEIKSWEQRFSWVRSANDGCGGPKLRSFRGDSKKLTPRARWKTWLGYQEPFDRHDWVVERCKGEVEYVIDFYKGKGEGLSFFLDVRPKLNSWEGWKMRVGRFLGWGRQG